MGSATPKEKLASRPTVTVALTGWAVTVKVVGISYP